MTGTTHSSAHKNSRERAERVHFEVQHHTSGNVNSPRPTVCITPQTRSNPALGRPLHSGSRPITLPNLHLALYAACFTLLACTAGSLQPQITTVQYDICQTCSVPTATLNSKGKSSVYQTLSCTKLNDSAEPAHLLAANSAILLNPVERVVHETTVAPHVVRVTVHQLLRAHRRNARRFAVSCDAAERGNRKNNAQASYGPALGQDTNGNSYTERAPRHSELKVSL